MGFPDSFHLSIFSALIMPLSQYLLYCLLRSNIILLRDSTAILPNMIAMSIECLNCDSGTSESKVLFQFNQLIFNAGYSGFSVEL